MQKKYITRTITIISILCVAVGLTACKSNEVEEAVELGNVPVIVKYEDSASVEGKNAYGGELRINKKLSLTYLDEESQMSFPDLARVVAERSDEKKEYVENKYEYYVDEMDRVANFTEEELNDYMGMIGWQSNTYFEREDYVQRVDSKVLSLLTIADDYEGQMSVSAYYVMNNYDVLTGEEIPISRVLPNINELRTYLIEEIEKVTDERELDTYCIDDTIDENINHDYEGADIRFAGFHWYMDDCGVMIVFEPYEIARNSFWISIPYDSGIIADEFLPIKGQEYVSEYLLEYQVSNLKLSDN